jgi:glycosyltransferase A (GT-A) superfamily protein (DUF2064 family)/SAM-dependent methyltransferase
VNAAGNALTVIVIAKEPLPGRVKTRLQSSFTPVQSAELASASLADTFAAVRLAKPARTVLALDGRPGAWLPAGVDVIGQGTGSLDLRLAFAFEQAFAGAGGTGDVAPHGPVLLVGMDTPQMTADLLTSDWHGADAALGLTEDGGFWAIGLREPCPAAFPGIPMSTPGTGAAQLLRLTSLGLRVCLLPTLRDVDTPDDATTVAALVPSSRFGRLHQQFVLEQQFALDQQFDLGQPQRVPQCRVRPPRRHPLELYTAALRGERIRIELADGGVMPLAVAHWMGDPDSADRLMLNRCEGTVLDLGCGPGRLVGALAAAGTPALGIDICPDAVRLTADRGACVLRRTVEGPLPAEGRWGTVLLADGNLGIGGNPEALLRRCRKLLCPKGLLLIEADPCDQTDDRGRITLIDQAGHRAHPLPWARLGSLALAAVAECTGFLVVEEWRVASRVFLALRARS